MLHGRDSGAVRGRWQTVGASSGHAEAGDRSYFPERFGGAAVVGGVFVRVAMCCNVM